jgi:hypothetical protein
MSYAVKNIPDFKVLAMIDRYRAEELHPSVSAFDISALVRFKDGVPESQGRAGVYAIYRADRTLIYVGMSLNNVAARVSKHASRNVQGSPFWQANAAEFVQTILVTRCWQAPSLEEFLIRQAQAYQSS